MERLILALVVVAVAAIVARIVQSRRAADPPTQPRYDMPSQIDRDDFVDPAHPWLVAVFSSDSCSTCADVVAKAQVVRSDEVAVQIVSFQADRELHERYDVDAVPCLIVADAAGVVQAGFFGPVTATDLWAAIADAREPGSVDRGTCEH